MLFLFLLTQSFAGMTLQADNLSADGVTVRSLSCDLNSGGFLALLGVVASIAPQKTALDACAPAGAAYEVNWKWEGGKTGAVTVGRSTLPAANGCVQKALQATTSGVDGSCKAILLVGKAEVAAAAAEGLLKTP